MCNYSVLLIVGRRMKNLLPVPLLDIMRYPIEVRYTNKWILIPEYLKIFENKKIIFFNLSQQACDALLEDHETKDLLNSKFNLLIIDGSFPECALGLQYKFNVPFMYINTVGFYTASTSMSGSPTPYSITPHFSIAMTDNMNFIERLTNAAVHVFLQTFHSVSNFNKSSGSYFQIIFNFPLLNSDWIKNQSTSYIVIFTV